MMKIIAVILTMSLFLFCNHDSPTSPAKPEKEEKKPVSLKASINHHYGKLADLNDQELSIVIRQTRRMMG